MAFQLKDDVLGIVGDEASLGKPVGSDIREGKRTTVLSHAFGNASKTERDYLLRVVGNQGATDSEVEDVKSLVQQVSGLSDAL